MTRNTNKYAIRWAAPLFLANFLNVAAAGSIYRVAIIGLKIQCSTGESLEDLQPFLDNNHRENKFPLVDFYIFDCPPPENSYAETFKKLNITVSHVNRIEIRGMPLPYRELEDEMLQGVLFSTLMMFISNVQYKFVTRRHENFTGINLSDLQEVRITCESDTLEEKPRSFFNRTLKVVTDGRISIISCPPPKKSYADFMRQLNISPDTVTDLELKVPPKRSLKASDFQEMVIRKLVLVAEGKHRPENNVLEPLSSLEEVTVSNMEFPPFPNDTNLRIISLNHGESSDAFGGCSKLKKLRLKDWEVPNMRPWLSHCTTLREMDLDLMSKVTVKRALNNLTMITSLNVTNSNLRQLDGSVLADVVNLKKLNLQYNSLGNINGDAFKSQSKLVELDLSWNILTEWLFAKYPQLVSLKKLILDRNPIPPLSNNYLCATSAPLPIEHISARYTEMRSLSLIQYEGELRWDNLAFVDFSHNLDQAPFSFEHISIPRRRDLTVDIRGNPLQGFYFYRKYHYQALLRMFKKSHKLTIKTDMPPVDCDCNYGWLGKALRELPHVSIEGATCAADSFGPSRAISSNDPKHQECYKYTCNNCTCRMDYYTLQVKADCRIAGLTEIPTNWTFVDRDLTHGVSLDSKDLRGQTMNLTEILASGNRIKTIREEDIPETLELLDLHNNDIDKLNVSVIAAMFELPSRRVLLSGNPIVCDCENRPLLVALEKNRDQIADYSKVRCVGTAKPLSQLSLDDLCLEEHERQVLIAAVSGASLLALLVAVIGLYYRYRQLVKVYLYARGLCLCCVEEEEADADRPFDAFISFAHEDDELVTEKILPYLENDYKLCVHTRTWVLGEMIHTQIIRSVALSRRTVIILSRNFVKSIWGMIEFKTAYVSALREGRIRVIIVVIDDVIEDEDLDPELKGYLKTNTYVKIDDPWFLKKLRYALPHRSIKFIGKVYKSELGSERSFYSDSGTLGPDSPQMTANNIAYHVDLNSGEEEYEMRAH